MLEAKALNHEHTYLRQGIGALFDNDIWMRRHKVFVIKRYVANDAQSVGNNAELEDIAKIPIDIELLNLRVSRSMRRHGTISNFIRIIEFIKALSFRVCLKLLDDPVSIFGIIFGNKCFDAGRIKDGHIRFCGVNRLTDRLGNINKVIDNKLEVI